MKVFQLTQLFLIFLISTSHVLAQEAYEPQRKFAPDGLKEDLRVLKEVLEKVHIGLYRYSTKETIDSLFVEAGAAIKEPITEIEFFKIVNKIIVSIRDEHTFALPSVEFMTKEIGQTSYAGRSTGSKAKLFPFFIKIIANRLYIDNNLSADLTLQRGDEILSINGLPAKTILDTLLSTIAGNGYIKTFRLRHLEQYSLHQTYNRFLVHYAIYLGRPDVVELGIRKHMTTQIQLVKVEALTAETIFNNYWRRYSTVNDFKKANENPLDFNILSPSIAYLRVSDLHNPVWSKYNYSHSTEFRVIFEEIKRKKVKHLIVDLRGNEGGNPAIGIELLKYLCVSDFRPYNYHEVINYKLQELKAYARDTTALPDYPDKLFIPTASHTFLSDPNYPTEAMSRPMSPGANFYNNKLYVLIDGATGSAASILATSIKVNRSDAVFIGEESGGDMEGPISGSGTDITLPVTRIRVDIPFIKRWVNLNQFVPMKGRGIIPDFSVEQKVEDLINHEDSQLKFTLKLIGR